MKEYWVNVYDYGFGQNCNSRKIAERVGAWSSPIYRIHVKMKEKVGLSREYLFTWRPTGSSIVANRERVMKEIYK